LNDTENEMTDTFWSKQLLDLESTISLDQQDLFTWKLGWM